MRSLERVERERQMTRGGLDHTYVVWDYHYSPMQNLSLHLPLPVNLTSAISLLHVQPISRMVVRSILDALYSILYLRDGKRPLIQEPVTTITN